MLDCMRMCALIVKVIFTGKRSCMYIFSNMPHDIAGKESVGVPYKGLCYAFVWTHYDNNRVGEAYIVVSE